MTEAPEGPLASCDSAFSCLLRLRGRSEFGAVQSRNVVNGETLSISRLMEVAGDLGLKAEHVRLDWQRLHALGFSHSLLVLFKDTNVVLLTGEGRDAASEVAVWDPRDPYGETVFIPREDFERTSTGHALIVAPRRQPARGHPAVLDLAGSPRRGTSCSAKPLREARILQSSQASN